eukprot:7499674-Pyramimonas_sp.AAC.2
MTVFGPKPSALLVLVACTICSGARGLWVMDSSRRGGVRRRLAESGDGIPEPADQRSRRGGVRQRLDAS